MLVIWLVVSVEDLYNELSVITCIRKSHIGYTERSEIEKWDREKWDREKWDSDSDSEIER